MRRWSKTLADWDPDNYDRFAAERSRPVRDLLAALPKLGPFLRITDLGCGSGLSTAELAACWPAASICGLDRSSAMLEKARARLPGPRWIQGDIGDFRAAAPQQLLLANASLHWLPEHRDLFPRLLAELAPGGVLAVQMPNNSDEPSHSLPRELAASDAFDGFGARVVGERQRLATPGAYYDWLHDKVATLDIWETRYLHRLPGVDAIVEWFSSTALRPYLDALAETGEAMQRAFLAAYRAGLARAYPGQRDGSVLLPMPRLFIVAQVAQ
jgi:trans-aconitate 2-methyltransferase